MDNYIDLPVEGGNGVTSLNGMIGALTLVGGPGITITPGGGIITISAPGMGSVTSVGLADGSSTPIYTISGSPVTSSGTLTFTLGNQTANRVFAGPASGGGAQPTFRALVSADLPAGTGTVTSVGLSAPAFLTVSGSPVTTSGTLALTLSGSALPVTSGGTGTNTAFTQGSVIFAGAAGVYSQDNPNFFWDDTNFRLGIGTNTPADNINVVDNSNSNIAGITIQNTNAGNLAESSYSALNDLGAYVRFGIGSSVRGGIGVDLSNQALIQSGSGVVFAPDASLASGGTSKIQFQMGGNQQVASVVIDGTGQIGVGITSPAAKIDVHGSSGSTIKIVDGNQASGKILTSDAAGQGSWQTPAFASNTLTNTHIFVGNASNVATDVAMSGDATIANTGAVTIANNAVSNAKLAQMPANTIKGNNTGGTANALDLTVAQVNTMLGDILANGTVAFTADQSLGSHKLTNVNNPSAAQDAATKAYVDSAVAALQPATAVYAATTANLVGTYNNGASGVGATFTITATGAFTVDGVTPPVNSRILIKNQSSGFQNGIYDLTVAGTTGVSPVFTRSADYNTASDMNNAGLIPVINGTTNALSSWQQVATITTVGTDSLVFTEFTANPSLYLLKANNLSDVASASTSFNNIAPTTTKGDLIAYSTTNIRVAVGSNGQVLTADSAQASGIKWATPTTGTVTSVALTTPGVLYSVSGSPITTSGTLALALISQSANTVLAGPTSGGSANPSFRALVAADLPAGTGTVTSVAMSVPAFLSVSGSPITTSGTLALTLSGTALPVANGGTGTTTAFTQGSVVFAGASGNYAQDNSNFFYDATNHRLGLGNAAPASTLDVTGRTNTQTLTEVIVAKGNVTGSTTITWTAGDIQQMTLTGNITLVFSGAISGQGQTLFLKQDGTGSRTITWPGSVIWANNGTAPTISTTANYTDIVSFLYDGTTYWGFVSGIGGH